MEDVAEPMGGRSAAPRPAVKRWLLPMLVIASLCGCSEEPERQPSAAELENFIAEVNRTEAVAKDEAVQASRAKEETVEQAHKERLEALD